MKRLISRVQMEGGGWVHSENVRTPPYMVKGNIFCIKNFSIYTSCAKADCCVAYWTLSSTSRALVMRRSFGSLLSNTPVTCLCTILLLLSCTKLLSTVKSKSTPRNKKLIMFNLFSIDYPFSSILMSWYPYLSGHLNCLVFSQYWVGLHIINIFYFNC